MLSATEYFYRSLISVVFIVKRNTARNHFEKIPSSTPFTNSKFTVLRIRNHLRINKIKGVVKNQWVLAKVGKLMQNVSVVNH